MTTITATADEGPQIPADTFSARLVLLRHDLHLTVDQVSSMCGVPSATWSTWERGTRPRDKEQVVRTIAEATGYDRDWLMWGGFPLRAEWDLLDGGADLGHQPRLPFRAHLRAA